MNPLIRHLNANVISLRPTANLGWQIWSICTMRKVHTCRMCHRGIERGVAAWRPMTNVRNRGDRVCVSCVEKIG